MTSDEGIILGVCLWLLARVIAAIVSRAPRTPEPLPFALARKVRR